MNQEFPILSWKRIKIDGIETPYIISDKGFVMNDVTGNFMLITPDKDNYPVVKLFIDGEDKVFKIHRLVCEAFNENPFDFPEVDHINRNHWDASKENLEYVTGQENMRRLQKSREIEKIELANYLSGEKNAKSVYTPLQILQVCMRLTRKERTADIFRKTSVDVNTIYLVKVGKIWKNVSCYFDINNDGFLNEERLDKIIEMIHRGSSNELILHALCCPYCEYFNAIVQSIRESIENE